MINLVLQGGLLRTYWQKRRRLYAYLERYRVISRWNQNVRESLHIILNAARDWAMVLIPLSRNTFDSKFKHWYTIHLIRSMLIKASTL